MADQAVLNILQQGVAAWNEWRTGKKGQHVDFTGADLQGINLSGAELSGADFSQANLSGADLSKVNLRGGTFHQTNLSNAKLNKTNLIATDLGAANLQDANLFQAIIMGSNFAKANLQNANFSEAILRDTRFNQANLTNANFTGANLNGTDLTAANLNGTNLQGCTLVKATMEKANLENCRVYGTAVWDIIGEPATQTNLIITDSEQAEVTVDNIKVAQFIHLILSNEEIRGAIDTLTSKSVLILGRFYKERKDVLDALRAELRQRDYVPILFDFEKPKSKDLTETVSILAQMSRFIIADITDAKSIPQELKTIVPDNPSIPVASIISKEFKEYAMYEHLERYPWVLPLYEYESQEQLLQVLKEKIIDPAEQKSLEVRPKALS